MLWMPKKSTAFVLCAVVSAGFMFAPSAMAQTSSAPSAQAGPGTGRLLEFEVATIKPEGPQDHEQGTDVDPSGIVRLHNLSLKAMIGEAFDVSYWQIEGGDPWMEKNLYNVVGQPPDNVRQSMPDTRHTWYTIADPRLREMLQALLIQRFQLKVRRTTQMGKVYFLERTAKPLALIPTKAVPAASASPQGVYGEVAWAEQWVLSNATMPQLADFASSYVLHRPVMDHTGLTGAFDYRSPPDDPNTSPLDHDSSFMQMLKNVGLELEPGTGPAEMLVIDHAELPSPN
jgi:uncharacterized protein (TIGR03435 family)